MITVLYVDADAQMRSIISHLCERTSTFSVHATGSYSDALAWLRKNRTDVIVSNNHLEETDGITLLRMIRQKGSSIPFIFFTEDDDSFLRNSAYMLDAFGFIVRKGCEKKPILNLMRMIYWAVGRNDMDAILENIESP
jgi:DNA-binding NarL/FixJ family response regulator